MTRLASLPPLLLPAPRSLKLFGQRRAFPDRPGINSDDESLYDLARRWLDARPCAGRQADILLRTEEGAVRHPGAFSLRLELSGAARVFARDRAGFIHALGLLRQLRRQYGPELPTMLVEDRPAFGVRGVMLDISRDRVPTMQHLFDAIDQFAELRINHLQLYTEHTFAYAEHEEVWHGWSPMTGDEIRRLDERCRSLGITLAANQNCFGHLAPWLRRPRYASLAEIEGNETVWKFYHWDRKGPFSLCPTDPGSLVFVRGLLSELLPHFSSGLVNINCDETFDVGQGRSKDAVASRGGRVYLDYLAGVNAIVRELGSRGMFWADVALSHPESLDAIPGDLIRLAWGYEPDADFANWCRVLRARDGCDVWVCPGTSSWRSFTGRTGERRGNMDRAAREGLEGGASGLLACDWGDVGHRQQWPISMHGIANAAEAAWNGDGAATHERLHAESLHAFGDRSLRIGAWLESLGALDADLRSIAGPTAPDGTPGRLRNATAFFHDYHLAWEDPFRPGDAGMWGEVADRSAALARERPDLGPLLNDELDHACRCVRAAAWRGSLRRREQANTGARADLRDLIREVMADHARLWGVRSRTGGLLNSASHDARALEEIERLLAAARSVA